MNGNNRGSLSLSYVLGAWVSRSHLGQVDLSQACKTDNIILTTYQMKTLRHRKEGILLKLQIDCLELEGEPSQASSRLCALAPCSVND